MTEGQMFIKLDKDRQVRLEDRDNFRAFKIVIEGQPGDFEQARQALSGVADLADADTAWVFMVALRNWSDVAPDTNWQQSFTAMIEKARPHGWIDDQRHAIKAHVEWTTG
jgi:hypothetical protein